MRLACLLLLGATWIAACGGNVVVDAASTSSTTSSGASGAGGGAGTGGETCPAAEPTTGDACTMPATCVYTDPACPCVCASNAFGLLTWDCPICM